MSTWVRHVVAGVVTLVLHVVLLSGSSGSTKRPPLIRQAVSAASWVMVDVAQPQPAAKPTPAATPRLVRRTPAFSEVPGAQPASTERSRSSGTDRPVRAPGEVPTAGVSLLPSLSGVANLLPTPEPGFKGKTVRNGPEERGDPAALAEYEGEITKRRVDGLLSAGAATAAAATGNIDPYFMTVLGRMRRSVAEAELPDSVTGGVPLMLQAYGALAQSFARGNLSEPPEPNGPMPSGLHAGNVDLQRNIEGMALSGKMTQRMLNGSDVVTLEAVVELEHAHGGGVALANVVRSSGTSDFDDLALHHAKKGFLGPENGPDSGVGTDGAHFRSFWRFTWQPPHVRVELLRLEAGGRSNPFVGGP